MSLPKYCDSLILGTVEVQCQISVSYTNLR